METNEVMHVIETFQDNILAGTVIALYYVVVYWPRIRDGLGLTKDPITNLDKLEKNYQLMKLRIEVEQAKQASGLDDSLLQKIEDEMQQRLVQKKSPPFNASQKFVAIPLILFLGLITLSELASPQDPTVSALDTFLGFMIFSITIVIGFWGIPVLQKQNKSKLRTFGFSVFWAIAFFLISYLSLYILLMALFAVELSEEAMGWLFLLSIVVSSLLGFLHKLPYMNTQIDSKQANA